ncbi:MAG: hypothetical protein AYP45_10720 [Candidatus Brocadia carolinensis]|uniref:Uncharacterized protein n=1 Tax=Candidatus Brocadia carolinensis TaxID=1004156 RepID=A0A1V4ASN5_9BACT|nr:MAG: hypothetical protein AYP45_10720 [Candidatus Brocadia caroliniensis]
MSGHFITVSHMLLSYNGNLQNIQGNGETRGKFLISCSVVNLSCTSPELIPAYVSGNIVARFFVPCMDT